MARVGFIQAARTKNSLSASRFLTILDANLHLFYNGSSAITLTIPASLFPASTEIEIAQLGTGVVTITPDVGVSINGSTSSIVLSQNTVVTLNFYSSTSVVAIGANSYISQTANTFFAAPNGSTGTPLFRSIAWADVSALSGTSATSFAIGNDSRFTTPTITGGTINNAAIGATTANTGRFTNLTVTGQSIITPPATQTLTATSTINITNAVQPISAASAITLTSNPQVSTTSVANGQQIQLINVGSFNISLANGNGLNLGRSITLAPGRTLNLIYSSTLSAWCDLSYFVQGVTSGLNANDTALSTNAYVNTSNRPYLSATRITTTQSIPHNTITAIVWNSATTDTNSILNTTTGVFTIPAGLSGLYMVNVGAFISTTVNNMVLSVFTGTTEVQRITQITTPSNSQQTLYGSALVNLSASTAYTIRLYQTNSGATAVNLNTGSALTYLTLCRMNV
jgi:hypothetical protein